MLLHSNEHLQISTVADRLSMFMTWEDSMEDSHKAFDTTWHTGLLYNLSKLYFSVSLIKLISSFLYKRKLFVSVEGEMSTPRIMQVGVPQGSVLSPTMFNMYVNDTPQATGVHLALFADDTCLYATERK
jgi:hypothetical protein